MSEQKRPGDVSMTPATRQVAPREPSAEQSGQIVNIEREKQRIKDCFYKYKSSILNSDGNEAVQYLDQKTKDYYAQLLEWALTAKRTEVERLSVLDKMQVLIMRYRVPAEQLRNMTAEELLVYSIDKGMVGKNSVEKLETGMITVDGNFGKATILSDGKDTRMSYHFNKENGQWKMDLTSTFPVLRIAMDAAIKQSGQSEKEFIFMAIGSTSPKQPTDDIWNPIGK